MRLAAVALPLTANRISSTSSVCALLLSWATSGVKSSAKLTLPPAVLPKQCHDCSPGSPNCVTATHGQRGQVQVQGEQGLQGDWEKLVSVSLSYWGNTLHIYLSTQGYLLGFSVLEIRSLISRFLFCKSTRLSLSLVLPFLDPHIKASWRTGFQRFTQTP